MFLIHASQLAKSLFTVATSTMPDDKEKIASIISSAPERQRPLLKWFGAFVQKKRTGVLYPTSVAIDTTLACNFACPHCYIADDLYSPTKENVERGLSVEGWTRKFEELHSQNPFLFHASWVGGEPMLRRNLLEQGVKHFSYNWIHTNGYFGFPIDLGDENHKITYIGSIDGDIKHHDKMRPTRGASQPTYERILNNIRNSKSSSIIVHTVISPDNSEFLGAMLKELYDTGRVKAVGFSFLSPQKGSQVFEPEQRDEIVDQLLGYRRQYGNFIFDTPSILRAMRSGQIPYTYADGCLIKIRGDGTGGNIPLNAYGLVKEQCVMGPEQSCEECGCEIPAQYSGVFDGWTVLERSPVFGRLLDYTIKVNRR